MAKLNASERKAIPTKDFALPGRRYPIHDRAHAANAKARAAQQLKAGNLTQGEFNMINRKANSRFGFGSSTSGSSSRSSRSSTSGRSTGTRSRTNVNSYVAPRSARSATPSRSTGRGKHVPHPGAVGNRNAAGPHHVSPQARQRMSQGGTKGGHHSHMGVGGRKARSASTGRNTSGMRNVSARSTTGRSMSARSARSTAPRSRASSPRARRMR